MLRVAVAGLTLKMAALVGHLSVEPAQVLVDRYPVADKILQGLVAEALTVHITVLSVMVVKAAAAS
jgi:hypothetical protein